MPIPKVITFPTRFTIPEAAFIRKAATQEGIPVPRLIRIMVLSRLGWTAPIETQPELSRQPQTENPRTKQMLEMRMKGTTFQNIGKHYGITRARVHQLIGGVESLSRVRARLDTDIRHRTAKDTRITHALASWWRQVQRSKDGCWTWTGYSTKMGYGRSTKRLLFGREEYVHRQSFYLSNGYFPKYPLGVLHRCNNPLCVRSDHLYEGTAADNYADALVAHGGIPWNFGRPGPRNPERDRRIVVLRGEGKSVKEISAMFNLSAGRIYNILIVDRRTK